MPRNVSNFWIKLAVDGSRHTRIETGPRSKDGGFSLVILQRDNGNVVRAMEIDGRVLSDGSLKLVAARPYRDAGGECTLDRDEQSLTIRTKR